jgi:hypothetical protein
MQYFEIQNNSTDHLPSFNFDILHAIKHSKDMIPIFIRCSGMEAMGNAAHCVKFSIESSY